MLPCRVESCQTRGGVLDCSEQRRLSRWSTKIINGLPKSSVQVTVDDTRSCGHHGPQLFSKSGPKHLQHVIVRRHGPDMPKQHVSNSIRKSTARRARGRLFDDARILPLRFMDGHVCFLLTSFGSSASSGFVIPHPIKCLLSQNHGFLGMSNACMKL